MQRHTVLYGRKVVVLASFKVFLSNAKFTFIYLFCAEKIGIKKRLFLSPLQTTSNFANNEYWNISDDEPYTVDEENLQLLYTDIKDSILEGKK